MPGIGSGRPAGRTAVPGIGKRERGVFPKIRNDARFRVPFDRPNERSAVWTIWRWVSVSGPASSYRAPSADSDAGPPGNVAITQSATSWAQIG